MCIPTQIINIQFTAVNDMLDLPIQSITDNQVPVKHYRRFITSICADIKTYSQSTPNAQLKWINLRGVNLLWLINDMHHRMKLRSVYNLSGTQDIIFRAAPNSTASAYKFMRLSIITPEVSSVECLISLYETSNVIRDANTTPSVSNLLMTGFPHAKELADIKALYFA
jgi:hypothetical protein